MNKRCWIQVILLPFAIAALGSSVQAQGKGKGQGAEKANQGQERGGPKPEKTKAAPATAMGPTMTQQRGKPANTGQPRAAENRPEHAPPGRAVAAGRNNVSHDNLPASANASPRASVASAPNRGREISRLARDLTQSEVRPSVQRFVVSNRAAEHVTGGAIAYALARGIPDNAVVIAPSGNDVWVRNKRGDALLVLDDDRARNLGAWQVSPLAEPVKEGAPSFCRSGAGHPVWGRQWCLEKGFGLGTSPNVEWAAARDIGDLVYVRPVTTTTLAENALLNLLGPVAFDRLALHALTLGYTDPLTGVWRSDATGPTVLLVNSGPYPVAELVDGNRDQRPDLMLVALRPW
ncbi:MAG: hypothetical protein DMD63_06950 [Gemmatimonadetes bacterium]|nr:MAG: hypothetical protein DMD63_06950 [Gemmatimonadota bacterium]